MKTIIDRLTSETPVFWKKVRNISITAVTISGVIITLPTMGLAVPAALLTAAQYIAAIGATLGISAQATKVDSNETVSGN